MCVCLCVWVGECKCVCMSGCNVLLLAVIDLLVSFPFPPSLLPLCYIFTADQSRGSQLLIHGSPQSATQRTRYRGQCPNLSFGRYNNYNSENLNYQ